jgi:hypothetical protein
MDDPADGFSVYQREESEEAFRGRVERYDFPLTTGVRVVGWPSMYHLVFEKHASDYYADTLTNGVMFVALFLTEYLQFMQTRPKDVAAFGDILATLLYTAEAIDLSQDGDATAVQACIQAVTECLKRTGIAIVPAPNRGPAAHTRMLVVCGNTDGVVVEVTVVDAGGASKEPLTTHRATTPVQFVSLYNALFVSVPPLAYATPRDATNYLRKTLRSNGFAERDESINDFVATAQLSGGCSVIAPWYAALLCLEMIHTSHATSIARLFAERARKFVASACARLALVECFEGEGLHHLAGRTALGAFLRRNYDGVYRLTFPRGAGAETVEEYASRIIDGADMALLQRVHASGVRRLRRDGDGADEAEVDREAYRGRMDGVVAAFRSVYPHVWLRHFFPAPSVPKSDDADVPMADDADDSPMARIFVPKSDDQLLDDDDIDNAETNDGVTWDGSTSGASPKRPPPAAHAAYRTINYGPVWDPSREDFLPRADLTADELFGAIATGFRATWGYHTDADIPTTFMAFVRLRGLVETATVRALEGESFSSVDWDSLYNVVCTLGAPPDPKELGFVARRDSVPLPGYYELMAGLAYCCVRSHEEYLRARSEPAAVDSVNDAFYPAVARGIRPLRSEVVWMPDGKTIFPTSRVVSYLQEHIRLCLPVYQIRSDERTELLSPRAAAKGVADDDDAHEAGDEGEEAEEENDGNDEDDEAVSPFGEQYDARGLPQWRGFRGMMAFLGRCMSILVRLGKVVQLTPFRGRPFVVRPPPWDGAADRRGSSEATTNHAVVIDVLSSDLPRTREHFDALASAGKLITPLAEYTEHPIDAGDAGGPPLYLTASATDVVETPVSIGDRSVRDIVRLYTGRAWLDRASKAINIAPPSVALAMLVAAYTAGWGSLVAAADADVLARPEDYFKDGDDRAVAHHLAAVARLYRAGAPTDSHGASDGPSRISLVCDVHLTARVLLRARQQFGACAAAVFAYATYVSTSCTRSDLIVCATDAASSDVDHLAGLCEVVFVCKLGSASISRNVTRLGPDLEMDTESYDVAAARKRAEADPGGGGESSKSTNKGKGKKSKSASGRAESRKRPHADPPPIPYVSLTATHAGNVRREDFVLDSLGPIGHPKLVWVLQGEGNRARVRGHLSKAVTVAYRMLASAHELVDPQVDGVSAADLGYKRGTPVTVVTDWGDDDDGGVKEQWYAWPLRQVKTMQVALHFQHAKGGRVVVSVDGLGHPVVFWKRTDSTWHTIAVVRGETVRGAVISPRESGLPRASVMIPGMWTRDGPGVVLRDERGDVRVLFSVPLETAATEAAWASAVPWRCAARADERMRFSYDTELRHGETVLGWFSLDRSGLVPTVPEVERPFARTFFASTIDTEALCAIRARDVGPKWPGTEFTTTTDALWVPSDGLVDVKTFSLGTAAFFQEKRSPPTVHDPSGCFAQQYNGCCPVGAGMVGRLADDIRALIKKLEPTDADVREVTKALLGLTVKKPDEESPFVWPADLVRILASDGGGPLARWIYRALYARALSETERKLEELRIVPGVFRVRGRHLAGALETILEMDHDTPRTVGDVVTEMTTGFVAKTRQLQFLDTIQRGPAHGVVRQFPMGGGKTSFIIPDLVVRWLLQPNPTGVVVIVPSELVQQTAAAVERTVAVLDATMVDSVGEGILTARDISTWVGTFVEPNTRLYDHREDVTNVSVLPGRPGRVSVVADKALQAMHLSSVLNGGSFAVRKYLKRCLVICDEVDTVVDPLSSELNIPDVRSAMPSPPQIGTVEQVYRRMLRGTPASEAPEMVNTAIEMKFGKGYGFGTRGDTAAGMANIATAIPYRGANAPANGSRFSSDQLRTALTTAAYISSIAVRRVFRPEDVVELFDDISEHTVDGDVLRSGVLARALPHCPEAVHVALAKYGSGGRAEDAAAAITAALADAKEWTAEEAGLFAVQCAARVVDKYTRAYQRQYSVGVLEFLTRRTTSKCVMFSGTVNIPELDDGDAKLFVAATGSVAADVPMYKRDVAPDDRTASLVAAVISGYACGPPSADGADSATIDVVACDTHADRDVERTVIQKMGMVKYGALIDTTGVLRKERPLHYARLLSRPLPESQIVPTGAAASAKGKDRAGVTVRDVLYVEDGVRTVLDGNTGATAPCTSMIGRPRPVVIFYDQKSTVGVEFEQAVEMRGLVTVDSTTTLTELAQAVFRLRKQTTGHSVDFLFLYDSTKSEEVAAFRRFADPTTRMRFLNDNEVAKAQEGSAVWAIANAVCLRQTSRKEAGAYSRELWVGGDRTARDGCVRCGVMGINSWLLSPGTDQAAVRMRYRLMELMSDAGTITARSSAVELSVEAATDKSREGTHEVAGGVTFSVTANLHSALRSPLQYVHYGEAAPIAKSICDFVQARFHNTSIAPDALAVFVRLCIGTTFRRRVRDLFDAGRLPSDRRRTAESDPRVERLFALVLSTGRGGNEPHVRICTACDASAVFHILDTDPLREGVPATDIDHASAQAILYSRTEAVVASTNVANPLTAARPAVFADPLFWTCCLLRRSVDDLGKDLANALKDLPAGLVAALNELGMGAERRMQRADEFANPIAVNPGSVSTSGSADAAAPPPTASTSSSVQACFDGCAPQGRLADAAGWKRQACRVCGGAPRYACGCCLVSYYCSEGCKDRELLGPTDHTCIRHIVDNQRTPNR